MRRGLAIASALVLACLCAGCAATASVGEDSPQVADVQLSAINAGTEASQSVQITLVFDQEVSVRQDAVADDFTLLINGEEPDADVVDVEVLLDATSVTFALRPAEGASQGVGAGSYFALYAAQFQLSSTNDDGSIPSVTGAGGSCAVLAEDVTGTLPSGLAIEVTEVVAGSSATNTAARTTFEVTSPALARVITWFSPDGGQTVLLKHNHTFLDADAADCAADLADVVNAASGLGVTATADGAEVTLTATSVVDGQELSPVVVEGVGVAGGVYDASDGVGEE